MDPAEYCRQVETYLCRKNDGHLIRIVGPAFELVSKWETDGVPMKVAFEGIGRHSSWAQRGRVACPIEEPVGREHVAVRGGGELEVGGSWGATRSRVAASDGQNQYNPAGKHSTTKRAR